MMAPEMLSFLSVFIFLVIFLITALAKATYLVQQAEVVVIERLGKFHSILKSGIHFVIPFVDRPRISLWTRIKEEPHYKQAYRYLEEVERLDLRESVYDFPKQNVITRDNVTMEINALLYYQITDPKSAIYEVNNLPLAIEKITQTTLRNVIGHLDLDETLTSRDKINEKLRIILDDATDKWGVKVNRVELQEVNPPNDIRVAMEKQMRAERDRRAVILEAEGKKRAAVLQAEGEKISKITRAEGEAQARLEVSKAEAKAIDMIKATVPDANPLPYMVASSYIKVLPELTQGKDNKMIILPYEASSLMGSIATIKEIFNTK